MLTLAVYPKHSSEVLKYTMSEFVSSIVADIVTCYLDFVDDGFDLNFILPEAYVETHDPSECYAVLRGIKARLQSSVMYREIKPLYQYAIFYMIYSWIRFYESYPEEEAPCEIHYIIPDGLKDLITTELDSEEASLVIQSLEDLREYNTILFEDYDFDEEMTRSLAELAIRNPIIFSALMGYEELDQYIDVMPADVAEEYLEFREKKSETQQSISTEEAIVVAVQNAMNTFAKRVVHHINKSEIELTAELQEKIDDILATNYGVLISREFTMGRAIKMIGETDLYFCMKDSGLTVDIAVLENKNIENFEQQYLQLMGYLNPNFKFGMTVSINRKMTITEAKEKIDADLRSIEGIFAVVDVYQPNNDMDYLISEHIVPENGKTMRVYHFILNLNDKSRVEAAKRARANKR